MPITTVESYLLGNLVSDQAAAARDASTWKPLHLFSTYRLILAGLLTFLVLTESTLGPFGSLHPKLYYWTCVVYLAFALAAGFASRLRSLPYRTQVYAQVLVDVVAITVLMHASGGVSSGLGMLLVVSIAAGSLLMADRSASFFAAVATIALLFQQFYSHLTTPAVGINYLQSALLGTTLFATALLAHTLASRLRESEVVAARRSVDLANMAQLTKFVIQQLPVGVLAIDADDRIRLMNDAAWHLLGQPAPEEKPTLHSVSADLEDELQSWRNGKRQTENTLRFGKQEVMPLFRGIGTGQYAGTVVFLEDAGATTLQAQQMKLASLGRLTASIAHEVRNPLGAISHAAQLLSENDETPAADTRLLNIILKQSQRVNHIIESILQLSRRERSQPEAFEIDPWLTAFIEEFTREIRDSTATFRLEIEPTATAASVLFDRTHLHQILWNLCQNARTFAHDRANVPSVELHLSQTYDGEGYHLDVVDHGPGVAPELIPHLFEPFVTARKGGTGLGLYISRELAAANGGRLGYIDTGRGASFRLYLPGTVLKGDS